MKMYEVWYSILVQSGGIFPLHVHFTTLTFFLVTSVFFSYLSLPLSSDHLSPGHL